MSLHSGIALMSGHTGHCGIFYSHGSILILLVFELRRAGSVLIRPQASLIKRTILIGRKKEPSAQEKLNPILSLAPTGLVGSFFGVVLCWNYRMGKELTAFGTRFGKRFGPHLQNNPRRVEF